MALMEPFKHVTGVRVLGRYVVELEFEGAERRIADLEPLMDGPAFEELLDDYELFHQVKVDPDIATIAWPNGADLSPRTLYAMSQPSVPAGHR
jgi:hypothetical protein